ncbi:MAG: hypothetical protein WBC69_21730 [Geitlerinemataceae cyanobacterium]
MTQGLLSTSDIKALIDRLPQVERTALLSAEIQRNASSSGELSKLLKDLPPEALAELVRAVGRVVGG